MSYVLVWLPGDEATRSLKRMVDEIRTERPPSFEFLTEESASEDTIRGAVDKIRESTEVPTAVVLCHGGDEGLRSSAVSGGVWATVDSFGTMFNGCRVYVFACHTLSRETEPTGFSFGEQAKEKCVAVYVGHDREIQGDLPGDSSSLTEQQQDQFFRSACAAIMSFLAGVDAESLLRRAVVESFDDRDFSGMDDLWHTGEASAAWSTPLILQQIAESLHVLSKRLSE